MKRWIPCVAIIFLRTASLLPQAKVELFGYFESQLMGASINNEFIQMQSNKLRVDMESIVSDHIAFGANFDYITYHGKTQWPILDYLPDKAAAEAPDEYKSYYILSFEDRQFLDNAYLKLSFKYFDLTVGKQQISPGTGYAWNPTDVFNTKDLLDPTYEQPGHNAFRLDVPLGSRSTFTTFYAPGDDFKDSDKLIQFKFGISHFDFHLMAVEKTWRFHDYSQFNMDFLNPDFVSLPEKRRLLGFSTAGELLGLGLWTEFAYNRMEISDDFEELVAGIDYTFDSGTYIMAEYYRNTMGKTDYLYYTLNDWMRFLSMEQKAIARDQMYAFLQHPVTELIQLSLSTIYVISDQSAAIVPTLNYNLFENVDVFVYLNFYTGKEGAVFNKKLGNGGLIRARVYF